MTTTAKDVTTATIGVIAPSIGLAVGMVNILAPDLAQGFTLSGFVVLALLGTLLGILTLRSNRDAKSSSLD